MEAKIFMTVAQLIKITLGVFLLGGVIGAAAAVLVTLKFKKRRFK